MYGDNNECMFCMNILSVIYVCNKDLKHIDALVGHISQYCFIDMCNFSFLKCHNVVIASPWAGFLGPADSVIG